MALREQIIGAIGLAIGIILAEILTGNTDLDEVRENAENLVTGENGGGRM